MNYFEILKIVQEVFKAAMPFPCNGSLVVLDNLPRILSMSDMIYASFLSPI